MATMASPYRLAPDSPSRQLLWELSQLAVSSQQRFYAHLDHENNEREIEHRRALDQAAAEHSRVRRGAEQFREQLELQIQAERQKQEEEVQRELERQRQEKVARDEAVRKREIERARAIELEAKREAEVRKAENEAIEKQRREKEQRDSEIAKRLQKEREKQVQQQQQQKAAAKEAEVQKAASMAQNIQPGPTAQPTPQSSNPSISSAHEAEHTRYLEIHKNLKELRKYMGTQAKQNPELKIAMGEMRREIKKSVGQIREGKGKGKNTKQIQTIIETVKKAAKLPEPTVDITMFLLSAPPQLAGSRCPALLLYLLSIFAKAIVAQFVDEASVKPQIADGVGTVASHIFAIESFRWQGHTLIDILISKLHVVCPVLFGIYGDEKSAAGKDRLGWSREEPKGPFISQQAHFARMTGLGAGFAGITLRNYEKAVAKNPYPDYHYWQCMARITNTPPNQITQTHFIVLKAMIEGYEEKFLHFYGNAALAALRNALVELPKRCPPSIASKALTGLVDVQRRELKLYL